MESNILFNTVNFFDQHSYFVGCVEAIECDSNENVHLSGWAINFIIMDLPDLVLVYNNKGKIIATAVCMFPRPDVVSAFNNDKLLNSGWIITIPKENIEDSNLQEIKIFAFFKKEHSAYLLQNLAAQIDIDAKKIEEKFWMETSGLLPPDKSVPYYSCNFIEGGLIFTGNHCINLCCIINLKSPIPYDTISLGFTSKSEFSLKTILKKRKEVIEENQKGGYITCIGCQLLRKKMWPYRRDLFNYLNLMHSRSCNLLCKFCGVVNFDRSPNTPTEEVLEVIQTLTSCGYLAKNASIGFSGGEPVIIDGFDRLLGYLAKGEYQISIASNGTIFSNTICDALKSGKISTIIISVDAVSPEVYKSIKGKDFCNKVWENISRYAKVDSKKVIPKMIIMEENMNEIERFIQKCIESGIKNVMYDYDQNICPNPEIIDTLKLFNKYCNDYGLIGLPAREGLRELW